MQNINHNSFLRDSEFGTRNILQSRAEAIKKAGLSEKTLNFHFKPFYSEFDPDEEDTEEKKIVVKKVLIFPPDIEPEDEDYEWIEEDE